MIKQNLLLLAVTSLLIGCASVPTTSTEVATQLKQIQAPTEGKAGLYIYRSSSVIGASLKKDIWLDKECIGETARGVFFYKEVEGNKTHVLATESEFSPNLLNVTTEQGKNYFIQQYIKPGVFVGGANLKLVDEQEGQAAIQKLSLAESGKCSKPFPTKAS
ncbi:DUF2846 domain-containing protein [Acinetobacter puyangensis]|uniref:DUF2846 domain-containing protein n=1 Tax=Acinetobacter puyangensis TaxID=1096779 RepID=A0A240E5T5_9GAMM|nr:DUF2846 domain-containing protein [Acinetobacter puyangensis]SNX43936.1 Protein of unknown function [Acinetobacter puyangensis]